jgi:hypothetical protein
MSPSIHIRRASGRSDARAMARLAGLDSAPLPTGDVLVAEVEGRILAALPLDGSPAIADPFRRTKAIVSLLELRASQLGEASFAGSTEGRLRVAVS